MKQRILVVDDHPQILSAIEEILSDEDFIVITAENSEEAIYKARSSLPDLIILDIVLPGISGREVCKVLKDDEKTESIPIIMISGTSVKSKDKVVGLDIGADDYVTKPFHSGELLARVKAILRREEKPVERQQKVLKSKSEDIYINLNDHTVQVKNREVELSPKEFDVLCVLMRKKGKVLSKDFLTENIWGYKHLNTTRAVDITVQRLRKKLGSPGKRIETVQTLGYRFIDEK